MRIIQILRLWCVIVALLVALVVRMKKSRAMQGLYGGLILLCMASQLLCLMPDGLLTLSTALPLHLCSFCGILSLPALLFSKSAARFVRRLAPLGALTALLFPAMLQTSRPIPTALSFLLLHALLLFLPLVTEKSEKRMGAWALSMFLILAALTVDLAFGANYLFLRFIPQGTPFDFLAPASPFTRALLWAAGLSAVLLP